MFMYLTSCPRHLKKHQHGDSSTPGSGPWWGAAKPPSSSSEVYFAAESCGKRSFSEATIRNSPAGHPSGVFLEERGYLEEQLAET